MLNGRPSRQRKKHEKPVSCYHKRKPGWVIYMSKKNTAIATPIESMPRKTHKTWPPQQLADKLWAEPKERAGFFGWKHQRLLIHAAKTALAAALCWWLAQRFGLQDGYWGSITAVIVLQSNFGATYTASRARFLGTLIGALVGFSCSLFGALPWSYMLALLIAMMLCGLLGLNDSMRLAGVTITIIMLVHSTGSHHSLALIRVGEVFLGIVVALAISTLVYPDRARLHLRDGLAREFLALGTYFEGILQGLHGAPAENLQQLHQAVLAQLSANNKLLAAARNEPSGGSGWREGLEMLAQFGRELFDALVALELAVKGSHEDEYPQQLEPALEQLAADTRARFCYLAECIHAWRFHIPPPGLLLEEDIAELEARMNEVRPKNIQLTQAEILRVYAVQLHLKQIARLLCASRQETSRVIGEKQQRRKTQTASKSV
jgi:uncharacterized membrane protein YccC